MNIADQKNIFLKIIKPFIAYKNLDDESIMKLKLDDTEIDSLMLMEIIMELEAHNIKVKDSFMSSLDPSSSFEDIFDSLVKTNQ